jgi:hypothetical protein
VMENLSLFFSQLSMRFPKDRFFSPSPWRKSSRE